MAHALPALHEFGTAYRSWLACQTGSRSPVVRAIPRNSVAVIVSPSRSPSVQARARMLIHTRYVLLTDAAKDRAKADPDAYGWSGPDPPRRSQFPAAAAHPRAGQWPRLSIRAARCSSSADKTTGLKRSYARALGRRSLQST